MPDNSVLEKAQHGAGLWRNPGAALGSWVCTPSPQLFQPLGTAVSERTAVWKPLEAERPLRRAPAGVLLAASIRVMGGRGPFGSGDSPASAGGSGWWGSRSPLQTRGRLTQRRHVDRAAGHVPRVQETERKTAAKGGCADAVEAVCFTAAEKPSAPRGARPPTERAGGGAGACTRTRTLTSTRPTDTHTPR